MSVQPISYAGLPKALTGGVQEPTPSQPAFYVNALDDYIQFTLVPSFNAMIAALRSVGAFRWEIVDARASVGRQAALRGDPTVVATFGPPQRVQWLVDPGQDFPANFYERGRVADGVTYPGDELLDVAAPA